MPVTHSLGRNPPESSEVSAGKVLGLGPILGAPHPGQDLLVACTQIITGNQMKEMCKCMQRNESVWPADDISKRLGQEPALSSLSGWTPSGLKLTVLVHPETVA